MSVSAGSPAPAPERLTVAESAFPSKLFPFGASRSAERTELALAIAERLLAARDLNDEDHVLLKRNVATCLVNGLSMKDLRQFGGEGEDAPVTDRMRAVRWKGKLERELASPYTDREVLGHVRELDGELKEKMAQLLACTASYPAKVYVLGSFVKGRLGKNSDLDVVVEVADPKVRAALGRELAEKKTAGDEDGVLVVPEAPRNKFLRAFNERMWGKSIDAGTGREIVENDGWLLDRFGGILAGKGLEVRGDKVVETSRPVLKPEVGAVFLDNLLEKVAEKKTLSGGEALQPSLSAMDVVGTVAGMALLCPLAGAVAGGILSSLISQE